MDDPRFSPPPGLPEYRARAWVKRHRKRWLRVQLKRAAVVFGCCLFAVSLVRLVSAGWRGETLAPSPDCPPQLEDPLPSPAPSFVALTLDVDVEDPFPTTPVCSDRFIAAVLLEPELQEALWRACDEYGVPYEVAVAVAEKESGFDQEADNGICVGVMQINPVNYPWLEQQGIDPTTPEGNLQSGVLMLGTHMATYGDWHKALMAYNCGAGGAAKLWRQGHTSSAYSRAVLSSAQNWKTIIEKESF